MHTAGDDTPLGPVLRELSELSTCIQAEQHQGCLETIAALRQEVAELRATVAHLRAGRSEVPNRLRPVVARALLSHSS
jgi:hypothetical protein